MVNPGFLPVNKPLPTYLFQVWELQVGPWFNPFLNIVEILVRTVFVKLLSFRVHHPDFPVIKIDFIIAIHQSHGMKYQ